MTTCIDRLPPGPDTVLCPEVHCDAFENSSAFHAICNCVDWQGNPIPDCDPKDNLFPVQAFACYNPETDEWREVSFTDCAQLGPPWYVRTCFCCCACMASNTPIAGPAGFRAASDIAIGDQVLTGSPRGGVWSWTPQTVEFSNGSPPLPDDGPTGGIIMLYVEYGDGKSLVVTPNQLFALTGGGLKRADQLVPGRDSLAGADGSAVAIGRIATGFYKGGIHHLATSAVSYEDFDGLDGHLINANGVVMGDYLLQTYQDTPKLQPYVDQSGPAVGTFAYTRAHPELGVKPYVVGPSLEVAGTEITAPDFVPHGESSIEVPAGATALFTPRQEAMLLDPDIPKRGFSDRTNVHQARYFTKLFAGFYPDVEIVLDWDSRRPNVFGYTREGTPTVLIGGELLRLGPLYGPAIAIAISFGVAAATTEEAPLGRLVFHGVSTLLYQALEPSWGETVRAGQSQLEALLAALRSKEDGRHPGEGGLGAACLDEVVDAAVSRRPLPPCATDGAGVTGTPEPASQRA